MMNDDRVFFFPLHLDSGNRGCEAIARGTIEILGLNRKNYWGISRIKENDDITNLSSDVSYVLFDHSLFEKVIHRLISIHKSQEQQKEIDYRYKYKKYLDALNEDAVTLITGGDMMCYGDNEVNFITEYLSQKNLKVVLWGCSIGEENITPGKLKALKAFNMITARESLTYQFLTQKLGLTNVQLFPDSAFVLKPEALSLPNYFAGDCIGMNLSNFVTAKVDSDTMIGKNIIHFIRNVLENTKYDIVFIPHVFWPEQDDRVVCHYFRDYFSQEKRLHILETDNMDYNQIRYAISQCRYFIGARTHAVISAYAMGIPTIALGYSIKSRGIAKDLHMPDYSVLDYRHLNGEDDLLEKFYLLQSDTEKIRNILSNEMPGYIKKAYDSKTSVEKVMRK